MRLLVGTIMISASVLGAYVAMGRHPMLVFQPWEALIILVAAVGAFIIGNIGAVLKQLLKVFGKRFRGPVAQALRNIYGAEAEYFLSMKVGPLAHISGYPPVVAIAFARKAVVSEDRPSFAEVEEATANLPAAS